MTDTAQQRVEAARRLIGIIDGLAYIDPNDHIKCERAVVQFLETYDPQARREALAEVIRLHQEWMAGKHSGTFSDALDRLREGR